MIFKRVSPLLTHFYFACLRPSRNIIKHQSMERKPPCSQQSRDTNALFQLRSQEACLRYKYAGPGGGDSYGRLKAASCPTSFMDYSQQANPESVNDTRLYTDHVLVLYFIFGFVVNANNMRRKYFRLPHTIFAFCVV